MRLGTREGGSEGARNVRQTRDGYRKKVIHGERHCNDSGLERMRDRGTGLCREIHFFT